MRSDREAELLLIIENDMRLIDDLNAHINDLNTTINSWFDICSHTNDRLAPNLIQGFEGYVRTATNGGLSLGEAAVAKNLLRGYVQNGTAVQSIFPILLQIASQYRQELKPPEATQNHDLISDKDIFDRLQAILEITERNTLLSTKVMMLMNRVQKRVEYVK